MMKLFFISKREYLANSYMPTLIAQGEAMDNAAELAFQYADAFIERSRQKAYHQQETIIDPYILHQEYANNER